jgi:hypothetical protein
MRNEPRRLSKKAAWIAFGFALIAAIQGIRRSARKPFWLDEGLEIVQTCAQPVGEMFTRGAAEQCSPSPLYYPLQKLAILSSQPFDRGILVEYRLVSTISMALLILLFASWAITDFGWAAGLLAANSFFLQQAFNQYSSENRPYALWSLLFAAWLFVLFRIAGDLGRVVPRRKWTAAWLVGLALTLVSGAGMLQVGAGVAALLVLSRFSAMAPRPRRAFNARVLAIAGVCGGIGLFYGLKSCTFTDVGPFDLINTRDLRLVKGALSLLISPGSHQRQSLAVLVAFALAGFPIAACVPRIRERLPFRVKALGVILFGQLLVTIVIAASVALKHYHFSYRVFIHLIICQACAIVLCVAMLEEFVPANFLTRFRVGGITLAIAMAIYTQIGIAKEISRMNPAPPPTVPATACRPFQGPLELHASKLNWAFYPNAIVRLEEEIRRCGWVPRPGEPEKVLIVGDPYGEAKWYDRTPEAAERAPFLTQCGVPVTLFPSPTSPGL